MYFDVLTGKLKEVLPSVLPITAIVLILHLTLTPLSAPLLVRFLLGALLIIAGLVLFLIGVDIGIAPLGTLTGSSLAKTNRVLVIILAGLILGFFISIAEPGLIVLANQVDLVTSGQISSVSILITVSVGMAVMLALGFLRIVMNVSLRKVLTLFYGVTFIFALFTSSEFLAISFDASGATTGILAVPFILSLGVGVSKLKKDSRASEEDSFGLVAVTSVGAILSVMVMSIFSETKSFSGSLDLHMTADAGIFGPFALNLRSVAAESLFSLLPLIAILVILQKAVFKLSTKSFKKMLKGFVYAFLGLTLFLTGANAGFMDVGTAIGRGLAFLDNKLYMVGIGFVIGVVTILAEPAVHVLTHQIEDITSGSIKRKAVLAALSIGVGLSVALSVVRIMVPSVRLWHYLLPGYILSISMAHFIPELFVGIAFDAGGVATGPMTATFILSLTQGAADATHAADVLADGFGMIAMVALTPIITLQVLGFIFQMKSKKGGLPEDGEQRKAQGI